VQIERAAFHFLPDTIGKVTTGIRKCIRNCEMFFECDLALHGSPQSAAVYLAQAYNLNTVVDRCAETFLTLPVEIHLGPEQVLYKFEEAKLSTLGPVASLQLTRKPLTCREIMQKRLFD